MRFALMIEAQQGLSYEDQLAIVQRAIRPGYDEALRLRQPTVARPRQLGLDRAGGAAGRPPDAGLECGPPATSVWQGIQPRAQERMRDIGWRGRFDIPSNLFAHSLSREPECDDRCAGNDEVRTRHCWPHSLIRIHRLGVGTESLGDRPRNGAGVPPMRFVYDNRSHFVTPA